MSDESEQYEKFEKHYRPSACRSTTPFWSQRQESAPGAHRPQDDPNRSKFQHDRDKILYSRSFRRLRLKTQVFPERREDHHRTRLDHSLEVAQIARHFARRLQLNEDLVDAIGLAHDIGHTPFGHSGERALHKICRNLAWPRETNKPAIDGFRHNWQGLRTVDELEKAYFNTDGLCLTRAVRYGILMHSKLAWGEDRIKDPDKCRCGMKDSIDFSGEGQLENMERYPYEIQLCRIADDIGQLIHNFEDAIVSGVLDLQDVKENGLKDSDKEKISQLRFVYQCISDLDEKLKESAGIDLKEYDLSKDDNHSIFLDRLLSQMIYRLTEWVIKENEDRLEDWERSELKNSDRLKEAAKDQIEAGRPMFLELKNVGEWDLYDKLDTWLTNELVHSEDVKRMDGKAEYVLRKIFEVYYHDPDQSPEGLLTRFAGMPNTNKSAAEMRKEVGYWDKVKEDSDKRHKEFVRAIVDYIAGMTDRFALREYDQMYSAHPRRPV